MLKILVFTFFLSSTLWAQGVDNMKSQVQNDNITAANYSSSLTEAEKKSFTRKESLPVVLGAMGFIVGFIGVGYLTGAIVVAIKGDDENQISQIGAIIGSAAVGYLGAKLGMYLGEKIDRKDTSQNTSLNIAPIYDLENNGVGLGVALAF